jgi:hypothetical protein
MMTLVLWLCGPIAESLIIWRGWKMGMLRRFPFFFAYVASVFCADVSLFVLYYVVKSPAYPVWSARAELFNIVLGYSVVWEIFRHVLSRYPGVERFAQIVGLIVFVFILGFVAIYPILTSGTPEPHSQKVSIERDFLTVQCVFLLGMFSVIYYYGLEVGKNLRGMIVGYGIWLGASVITLALTSYFGSVFDALRILVQPLAYLLSLVVWLTALWRYSPIPVSNPDCLAGAGYRSLASTTRGLIHEMRDHLGRVGRP